MRDGTQVEDPRLGRLVPADWEHVERYSIAALPAGSQPKNVPVVIGVNWYSAFDEPQARMEKGRRVFYVAPDGELGSLRGGHCVCLEPLQPRDAYDWVDYYNQGHEGACVGFGWSRAMSLLNRTRYDARWLYREAQKVDEWEGEQYEGTSVRAAADVLRARGHRRMVRGQSREESMDGGIAANRWAQSADEVLRALGTPGRDYVTFLNSWGREYPRRVRMPGEVLAKLIEQEGEVAIPTDR